MTTTIACYCQTTQVVLSSTRPRACVECCCVDCFQKNDAPAKGPPTPPDLANRQRAPTLLYFENRMILSRGEVAFEQLRQGTPSTNMVCAQCRTVLCVHHIGYQTKVVLVFPDWANVEHYEAIPPALRWSVQDWSEQEQARLAPLPSLWNDPETGALVGDGHLVRDSFRSNMFQDCRNDIDANSGRSYDSFQSLLQKANQEIHVIGLDEDPRSLRFRK